MPRKIIITILLDRVSQMNPDDMRTLLIDSSTSVKLTTRAQHHGELPIALLSNPA